MRLSTTSSIAKVGKNSIFNKQLNDLRKIICLRKSEVSVEIFSVCKVIESLMEMPRCYTNDVIDMLSLQL